VLVAACGGTDDTPVVDLSASNSSCVPATTELDAGKTTFRIRNEGDQVTEVYIYAKGDRVVTERENIGPGTSADLTADLPAGTYEIACKPGQKGDGIRQSITVTGKGGAAQSTSADLAVRLTAVDFGFHGLDSLDLHAGALVRFEMTNKGTTEHEFEVFAPDGDVLGEVGPTPAGEEGDVVLDLEQPGTYRYVCGIDDHEQQGMAGTFEVA
jgi:uncharacterized cupredoxin-like copper-binding protein